MKVDLVAECSSRGFLPLHPQPGLVLADASDQRSIYRPLFCRTVPEDQFADVTYEIRIITLFKTEEDVAYPEEIAITTAANSAQCGIYLEVGDEYLLDLTRYVLSRTT